jgi:hypothetical protein
MAENVVSTDVGYPGVAVVVTAAGIVAAIGRLRRLPGRAPLVRWVSRALLTLALAAVGAAGLAPMSRDWAGYTILAAAVLTITAVLIAADGEEAMRLLAGVAFIGLGVAVIGGGAVLLRDGQPLAAATVISLGVAFVLVGAAELRGRRGAVGILGCGIALIVGGATLLWDEPLGATAFIGAGVVGLCMGIAVLRNRQPGRGWAIGCGVALVGIGAIAPGGLLAMRVAGIGCGVALVGIGILWDRQPLLSVVVISSGVPVIGSGIVAIMRDHQPLAGAALIGLGTVLSGIGIATLRLTGAIARTRARLVALTHDPDLDHE